jgi:SAM-dependent methyltransferase
VGRPLNTFKTMLDWGCGCGRTIRHLPQHFPGAVHGCDIEAEAIAWVDANLDFVRAITSGGLPPLPYDDGAFDLIINHSVMSHLDEAYQDAWLAELARVLSADGILILTVHGAFSQAFWAKHLPQDDPLREERIAAMYREVDLHGIYFMRDDSWAADFPSFYQNTFHAPWYVFEHWSRYLEIASYIPRGSPDPVRDHGGAAHKRRTGWERQCRRQAARIRSKRLLRAARSSPEPESLPVVLRSH